MTTFGLQKKTHLSNQSHIHTQTYTQRRTHTYAIRPFSVQKYLHQNFWLFKFFFVQKVAKYISKGLFTFRRTNCLFFAQICRAKANSIEYYRSLKLRYPPPRTQIELVGRFFSRMWVFPLVKVQIFGRGKFSWTGCGDLSLRGGIEVPEYGKKVAIKNWSFFAGHNFFRFWS